MDCSVSMQAQDADGTRFDAAKADMTRLVEDAPSQTVFSLVLLDNAPKTAVSGGKKDTVLRALEEAAPGGTGIDWQQAETLLKAEQDAIEGEIFLFGDDGGSLRELSAQMFSYGGAAENTALTLLSGTPGENGRSVLVHVRHYGSTPVEKEVTLFADGVAIDTKTVSLEAEGQKDVVFLGVPDNSGALEARMTPGDVQPADDVIYGSAGGDTKYRVLLVSEGNLFLEKALSLVDGVELYVTNEAEDLSGYGLYVFDGILPERLPNDGYTMFFAPEGSVLGLELGEQREISSMVTAADTPWEDTQSISFALREGRSLSADWGRAFLWGDGVPLALYGQPEGRKCIVFGFDLHDSDLPLKMEFPVLMYRLLEWYFPAAETMAQGGTGEALSLSLQPATERAWVVTPEGEEVQIAPPFPARTLTQTKTAGVYWLREEDSTGTLRETPFGLNVTTEESDLRVRQSVESQETSAKKSLMGSRDLTSLVLLLVLAAILIEWRVNCREN
nr:VWA domain-containing protein [Anaerotignum lactatifermentans]